MRHRLLVTLVAIAVLAPAVAEAQLRFGLNAYRRQQRQQERDRRQKERDAPATPVAVGDLAPSFLVSDGGRRRAITTYAKPTGPTVLVFARGGFDAVEVAHLTALAAIYDDVTAAGGELIVVFREDLNGVRGLRAARDATGVTFPLALDPRGVGSGKLYSVGADEFSAYVVGTDGRVTHVIPGSSGTRADPAAIVAAIGPAAP